MQNRWTTEHLNKLFREEEDLEGALEQAKQAITNPTPLAYLNELFVASGKDFTTIAQETRLSRSFVYQIFEGTRAPGREALLRLALVLGLNLPQCQRLLGLLHRGVLYPRIRREAILIYAIEHGFSLIRTDELLCEQGEEPLISGK